jgi:membrane dipeptidase
MKAADESELAVEALDDGDFAARAGVSLDAVQLLRASEVVDLHIESFIPPRLWGYDLLRRHGTLAGGRLFGHLDFPRALEGGLTGGMWSISTNIARTAGGRLRVISKNAERLRRTVEATGGRMRIVRSHAEWLSVRDAGAHGVLMSVQGGNAFEAAREGTEVVPDRLITRVTVVHLSNSCYGSTSSPASFWRGDDGLTSKGRDFICQLNASRVYVDLAHINRRGFWDAMEVHDATQPVLVTHTGVSGVRDMWRNIDDEQIRAVADTGGVVGIIFQAGFLSRRGGPTDGRMVIEHMQHVIDVAGEDYVALGSDYDGFIIPPPDLRDGAWGYARLVQYMLDEGWSEQRIQKVLGDNFIRTLQQIRPD